MFTTATVARRSGFTRTELLVVVSMLLLFVAVSLILRSSNQTSKARRLQCVANLRQVMNAITLYTRDNSDFFPPNPDDGTTQPGYNWCPGQAGRLGPQEFDTNILMNGTVCLVAPYLRSNASVFRCTMDPRKRKVPQAMPLFGPFTRSARTISMNGAVGTVDQAFSAMGSGHSGKPNLSVNAPWLNGLHTNRRNRPWRTYGKTTEITAPTPSNLFVLLEEDPDSINDACFSFSMESPTWLDVPGSLHEKSGLFAFADGHTELHRWVDARTLPKSHFQVKLLPPHISIERESMTFAPLPGSADWEWLSTHTSARATADQKGMPQH